MFAFLLTALFTGCARYGVVPERLEEQVNELRFTDVRDHSDEDKGEFMEIGEGLSTIKRLEDRGYSCRRGLGSEIVQVEKEEKIVPV